MGGWCAPDGPEGEGLDDDQADDVGGRAPARAATLTSSFTSFVTWAVAHYMFRGQIPPEVFGLIQLGVPAALGWAGACMAHRRAMRAAEAARGAAPGQGPTAGP